MQTFLPHPSFAASAAVLDDPRLGKQRVETLQILRALVLPGYGWQSHPAVGMWRGHVPALAAYGLATVDEWTSRGHADGTREHVLEFAPEAALGQDALAAACLMPAWLGDDALHESHRSRLIAKDPGRYRPLFPATVDGLDYHWPVPEAAAEPPAGPGLHVLRVDDLEPWRTLGLLGLPAAGPTGATAAWNRQLRAFEDELVPGAVVGVLADDEPDVLHLAEVTGPAAPAVVDGADWIAVAARFGGRLERAALPVPAVLQHPRRFFRVPLAGPPPRGAGGSRA